MIIAVLASLKKKEFKASQIDIHATTEIESRYVYEALPQDSHICYGNAVLRIGLPVFMVV